MTDSMKEERTTLTGQPITKSHDNLSNIMLGDGGAGFNAGAVGANLLPPGYTDASLVRIPIKISQYLPPSQPTGDGMNEGDGKSKKRPGFMKRVFGKEGVKDSGDLKIVEMSRGEYLKYWVKGNDGEFLDSVVEPEGGRAEWLRSQMEFNERIKKEEGMVRKE